MSLPYYIEGGIAIFPSQDEAIDQVLLELVQEIPAHFVLVTDTAGQVISVQGERGGINLVALGVLAVGDLAAGHKLAHLTNEHQGYQMVMRESQRTYTFISEAGCHLALFVQTSSDVPLGWARTFIQDSARRLAGIIAKEPED